MTFDQFHKKFPTAWENMVCNCGICDGCIAVIKRKKALFDSFKQTNEEIQKRMANILNEAFNNS